MGFSLKRFFEQLEEVLGKALSAEEKIRALEDLISEGKQYAKECRQLEN